MVLEDVVKELKIIIAGSRSFTDYGLLEARLDSWIWQYDHSSTEYDEDKIVIVSGKAKGADALGERYARERGYAIKPFPADWATHGRAAGPIRNKQMAEYGDVLFAFWDGESRGTANMIRQANEMGLEINVVMFRKEKT